MLTFEVAVRACMLFLWFSTDNVCAVRKIFFFLCEILLLAYSIACTIAVHNFIYFFYNFCSKSQFSELRTYSVTCFNRSFHFILFHAIKSLMFDYFIILLRTKSQWSVGSINVIYIYNVFVKFSFFILFFYFSFAI